MNSLPGATMALTALRPLVCDYFSQPEASLARRSRRNRNLEARELFFYLAVRELKDSGGRVGTAVGMGRSSSVSRAVRRGGKLLSSREECRAWWLRGC